MSVIKMTKLWIIPAFIPEISISRKTKFTTQVFSSAGPTNQHNRARSKQAYE